MVQRSEIVARGVSYGTLGGAVTGPSLLAVLFCLSGGGQVGGLLPVLVASVLVGAVMGLVVGLFGGVVFALAARWLLRHRILTVFAGMAVPLGFLGTVFMARYLAGQGSAFNVRLTLILWSITAPAGGIVAVPVLFGRRPTPQEPAG